MLRILVVEDDQKLCRVVCNHLNSHGYETTGCLNAQDAYDRMYHRPYALIVSDIMMPNIDGFAFAAAVRRINREIPILFMTAKDDYVSKKKGYQEGIDDYMVKPIDLNELVLRIGALLRRANIASENKLTVGSFMMNADDMTAVCNGEEIALTAREFNILFKLLSYPKRIFTRAPAHGGILGRGHGDHAVLGGCVYCQAAGQALGVSGFSAGHRSRCRL